MEKDNVTEAYKKIIIELSGTHFKEFKEKIIKTIDDEIDETKGTISNEHLFELGCGYKDENYHTYNIECYHKYIERLQELKSHINNFTF